MFRALAIRQSESVLLHFVVLSCTQLRVCIFLLMCSNIESESASATIAKSLVDSAIESQVASSAGNQALVRNVFMKRTRRHMPRILNWTRQCFAVSRANGKIASSSRHLQIILTKTTWKPDNTLIF